MIKTLVTLALVVVGAVAQTPEYLPLQVGNQWVYRSTSGPQNTPGQPPEVLAVTRQETVGGNTYAVLAGFGAEAWLRYSSPGVLVNCDRETRTEKPYLDFTAAEGASFPTSADPCNTTAAIESRSFSGTFPLGQFTSIAVVRYGGSVCADAGLTADHYLPNVGLLRRTQNSFAGPRTYDLIYARTNNTALSTSETSFTLATDKAVYLKAADVSNAQVRMALRHTDENEPLVIESVPGQEIEFILTDSAGTTLHKWSDGKVFTQELKTLRIRGERNWVAQVPLRGADGQALPVGVYKIEGMVLTSNGPRYRAQVTIEIAEVRPAAN